jgi:hypothetical protein
MQFNSRSGLSPVIICALMECLEFSVSKSVYDLLTSAESYRTEHLGNRGRSAIVS